MITFGIKVNDSIAVEVINEHVAKRDEYVLTYSLSVTVAIILIVIIILVKYIIAAVYAESFRPLMLTLRVPKARNRAANCSSAL